MTTIVSTPEQAESMALQLLSGGTEEDSFSVRVYTNDAGYATVDVIDETLDGIVVLRVVVNPNMLRS